MKSAFVLALVAAFLETPTDAFVPASHRPSVRTPLRAHAAAQLSGLQKAPLPGEALQPPPADAPLFPIPQFSWRVVAFFVANPAAFLPIAALLAWSFKLQWLGVHFAATWSAAAKGMLFASPLIAITLAPLERLIPALAEVTQASKTISLYAMGGSLRPLRAAIAATAISASAAICEELAFRGVLQTGLARVLALTALPASSAATVALVAQALVFGRLHAYTPSIAYLAIASAVGLAFGYAFVTSGNLFVPVVMHFASAPAPPCRAASHKSSPR